MKLSEVLESRDYELTLLISRAKERGVSGSRIAKVLKAAGTRDDAMNGLIALAGPERLPRPLPPLPAWVHERELEPYEEQIFLEMLEGEHQPQTTVG